jgi:hypothetical protein
LSKKLKKKNKLSLPLSPLILRKSLEENSLILKLSREASRLKNWKRRNSISMQSETLLLLAMIQAQKKRKRKNKKVPQSRVNLNQ